MNRRLALLALATLFAVTACFSDLQLSAFNLEVGPSPAEPGDVMVATVELIVNPLQRHTIILTIDDVEHFRETRTEAPDRPYIITLGDAAGLLATYGPGMHLARIELRAEEDNEHARTQAAAFELREAAP